MADITTVQAQPAFNNAALQLTETSLLTDSTPVNTIGQDGFENLFLQPVPNVANTPTANTAGESLLNLNNSTLSLFNEFSNDPENIDITGNLNAQQLLELGILQQDAQMLEEAAILNSHSPLNATAATTLDLSIQAQNITAADNNAVTPAGSSLQTGTQSTLTSAQLVQLNQVIAPFISQPLTPALVLQIQAELVANQINPLLISLSTLLLMQNYIASLQSPPREIIADNQNDNNAETTVDPVSPVDAVAVENSAILG